MPLTLGVLLVAAGWIVLFVAWYQTGQQDLETGQLPYVLSGGFGGWGLLLMGAGLIFFDAVRQMEWRAHQRLDEVQSALKDLASGLERPAPRERERSRQEPAERPAAGQTARRRSRRRRRPARPGGQAAQG